MRKNIHSLGIILLLVLFSMTPLSGNSCTHFPTVKTLRTEIKSLIKDPDLSVLKNEEESVKLSFLVNKNKELVIINVETENFFLDNYVRKNLNYKNIQTNYVQINKIYHIKLVFRKNKTVWVHLFFWRIMRYKHVFFMTKFFLKYMHGMYGLKKNWSIGNQ